MATQNPSSTSGQSASSTNPDQVQPKVGEIVDQAQATAGQVVDQAQEKVGQVVDQAKQQTTSLLTTQKDQAADTLSTVAHALRQTGQQLREQDKAPVAGYADQAATEVERISDYLHDRDVRQIVDDTEGFARQRPVVFVGGALVLGLVAARFLKSSKRKATSGLTPPGETIPPERALVTATSAPTATSVPTATPDSTTAMETAADVSSALAAGAAGSSPQPAPVWTSSGEPVPGVVVGAPSPTSGAS